MTRQIVYTAKQKVAVLRQLPVMKKKHSRIGSVVETFVGLTTEIEDEAEVHCAAFLDPFGFIVTYDSGKKVVDKSRTLCTRRATHVVYANSNTFSQFLMWKHLSSRKGVDRTILTASAFQQSYVRPL